MSTAGSQILQIRVGERTRQIHMTLYFDLQAKSHAWVSVKIDLGLPTQPLLADADFAKDGFLGI